ncbi:MAG: enoyl-CoA hydratase/isomerase family protein [Defluviitaleaceae bacterium]|nr:enoyl-CoA hydratase/isomerase family protein [Defluviitaleaceae bacterium]
MIYLYNVGAVKVMELERHPANAMDIQFLRYFLQCLISVEKESAVKTVVISSKCKAVFSSGLDLGGMSAGKNYEVSIRIIRAVSLVHKISKKIISSKKIYIAAINGAAIGSAVTIAMACDIRLLSRAAWFWLPDPMYGGLLADGGLDLIKNSAGAANAKRLCMTVRRINAGQINDMGLAQMSADKDTVGASMEMAQRISSYSYGTLAATKAIINRGSLGRVNRLALIRAAHSKDMRARIAKYVLNSDV